MPELTDYDKEFIRSYVAEATSEKDKKARRRECVERYDVSVATISAITAWTTIRANKTKVESRPIKVEVESEEGDHANYDNPTKQAWRDAWGDFIAKHTLQCEREKMKVLCLPGKKCLEIPTYLKLGFKPENIVGVEGGDDDARQEFLYNAIKYGIQHKLGRLENILEKETEVYDVVSYDFTGPLCRNYLDTIKMTPLAPRHDCRFNTKAFFMGNFLGKRELQETQIIIDYYASIVNPELQEMYIKNMGEEDNIRKILDYTNNLRERATAGMLVYEGEELKRKRDTAFIFVIANLLSSNYRRNHSTWAGYVVDKFDLPNRANFTHIGSTLSLGILQFLKSHLSNKVANVLGIGFPQILDIVSSYKSFVYDFQSYRYVSPVNNASSPFLSEMVYLNTPMADYGECRHLLKFILDAMCWVAKHDERFEDMYVCVRDKKGRRIPKGELLHHKDTIEFSEENGQIISSVQWGKIIQAYDLICGHIQKDKHIDIMTSGQNTRITLN